MQSLTANFSGLFQTLCYVIVGDPVIPSPHSSLETDKASWTADVCLFQVSTWCKLTYYVLNIYLSALLGHTALLA